MCLFSALYKTVKKKNKQKRTNNNNNNENQASLDLFKGEKNSFKIVICQYLPLVWELLLFLKLKSENDNNNNLEVNPPPQYEYKWICHCQITSECTVQIGWSLKYSTTKCLVEFQCYFAVFVTTKLALSIKVLPLSNCPGLHRQSEDARRGWLGLTEDSLHSLLWPQTRDPF